MLKIGSSGFPLIDTTISIFKPGTTEELKYNEVGEIAKSGPGIMLGYQSEELTKTVLKVHSDGTTWLHTGDTGFMNENGLLFVLGREGIHIFPNKRVFALGIENKILTIKGIREAIVTSGKDKNHDGFEIPYLFVIKEPEYSIEELRPKIKYVIENKLLPEEKPVEIFFIDKKPISKFKTDRKWLQEEYNL